MPRPRIRALLPLIAALALGCASARGTFNSSASQPDPIVAIVDGQTIRESQLDQWLKDEWLAEKAADPSALFELRSDGLDRMVDARVLEHEAASRSMTPAQLLAEQIEQLGPVTDEEIDDFYARNKERIRGGSDLEKIRPRIRAFLEEDRPNQAIAAMRSSANVRLTLEPPRARLSDLGASRGHRDAAVTIVEFSDYQCPFCKRVEPTLAKLLEDNPDDVRIVYRHFPLQSHRDARTAAEAAVCAERLGDFWAYHALIFENPRDLSQEELIARAEQVGIERNAFVACLAAPATGNRVDADIHEGSKAGAKSTPTFFVNGILMRGALPLEDFQKAVDAELARGAASQ